MVERQSIKFMASPVQYFFRPGCHGQFCNKSVKWLRPQAYPRLPQGVDRVVQLRKARELVLIGRSDTGGELFAPNDVLPRIYTHVGGENGSNTD